MDTNILLLTVGLSVACLGALMYFLFRNRTYIHKGRTTGIVTDSEEKKVTTTDKKGNEVSGVNHLTYFTYEVDGKEYQTARYTTGRYMPGQKIEIKYDPDDIMDCVEAVTEGTDPKPIYTALMGLGFLAMVIGLVMGGK